MSLSRESQIDRVVVVGVLLGQLLGRRHMHRLRERHLELLQLTLRDGERALAPWSALPFDHDLVIARADGQLVVEHGVNQWLSVELHHVVVLQPRDDQPQARDARLHIGERLFGCGSLSRQGARRDLAQELSIGLGTLDQATALNLRAREVQQDRRVRDQVIGLLEGVSCSGPLVGLSVLHALLEQLASERTLAGRGLLGLGRRQARTQHERETEDEFSELHAMSLHVSTPSVIRSAAP